MDLLQTIKRLLFFQSSKEEIESFSTKHFLVGLLGTWIVGMGRYWDDPGAQLLQHLGVGSVVYIFVLAFIIWFIVYPFKIKQWNYFTVLTFISLTSFPAIFYAIPVERLVSIEVANKINVWFLAIVACWRLALLFYFIKLFTELSKWMITTITLLPICLIISVLTILNLHRVVFNVMGGIREETPHDDAYAVLVLLTGASFLLILPLLFMYVHGIVERRKQMKSKTN